MKQDDTELIITNDIPDDTPTTPGTQPDTAPAEATSTPDADTSDGTVKEPEQSFREALHEQIHEEDQLPKQNVSIIKLLGGDFFTAQILRRQVLLMFMILGFIILHISNRYSCQKSMIEIDKLNSELTDAKYKALSTSSKLTEVSRQSNVLNMLKINKDSTLHIADRPPFKIEVPNE